MTCNTCYISDIPSGVGGSKSLRLSLVRRARSHARTSTTTDIYSHFLKSSDRTAAEKIEELFD